MLFTPYCLRSSDIWLTEPLEPIRQLRPFLATVGEFADEQRERLGVSRNPKRAAIHRIEPRVLD
jgi:hypothetical protein